MDWSESYNPNYFSIEDILATQERIPCKFELPVFGLGYLDSSSGSDDLSKGTKLELPCWMARALNMSRRHIVSSQLPVIFREKYREILQADPSVVNLHKLGPYFYDVCLHLLPIAGKDAQHLASLIVQTLRDRLRGIMDAAQNSPEDDSSSQLANLDELERVLFKVGQNSLRDHELWLARRSHVVKTSSLIDKIKKRKYSQVS